MVKQNRRRPSSASPTSRPRRVAGQRDSTPAVEEAEAAQTDETAPEPVRLEEPAPVEAPPVVESRPRLTPSPKLTPSPSPSLTPTRAWRTAVPASSPRPGPPASCWPWSWRWVLLALAGGIFLRVHDESPATVVDDSGATIDADDETPVRISGDDAQVAVAQAAQAAYTIVATSYEDYDAQVDEAAALMTPAFADEYRQTAEDVAEAILSTKTEVQVTVVAQGVVRADQDQVQALVFLNQFVTKDGKDQVFTPYRALVTVVNTDQGWLVSDLATK